VVLEVGAGLGQLTGLLAERAGRVVTVEVDHGLLGVLGDLLAPLDTVTLVGADVLASKHTLNPAVVKALREAAAAIPGARLRVVANPPYSISTPLVLACLDADPPFFDLHLTLQRELAERLSASPGTKAYGAATVSVQARAEVRILHAVPASAFWPRPSVDSVLLKIRPDAALRGRVRDRDAFRRTVEALFRMRRKTVRNGLLTIAPGDACDRLLADLRLDPTLRPEALPVEAFIAIADALRETTP